MTQPWHCTVMSLREDDAAAADVVRGGGVLSLDDGRSNGCEGGGDG